MLGNPDDLGVFPDGAIDAEHGLTDWAGLHRQLSCWRQAIDTVVQMMGKY